MTIEDHITFSLDEIKAVVFECSKCGARVAFSPERDDAPPEACPRGHVWGWNTAMKYFSTESPFRALLSALALLREDTSARGFKISLEIVTQKKS
jgi:hypothetical protein